MAVDGCFRDKCRIGIEGFVCERFVNDFIKP